MLNSIFVIIGTVIGAGFASGKEIFTFFNIYGIYGFIGLLFSVLLMGFIIYKTLRIIIIKNISSYSAFVDKMVTKSKFMNSVICNVINIFLLISFIVMIAGFSAYFTQELNLSHVFGAILIAVLCFFTFLNNIDGIVKINKYLIPFLIFIILLLGLKNLSSFTYFSFYNTTTNFSWIISSLLYASYNSIILIPILISLRKYIDNISTAKRVSIFTTFFLLLLSLILFCLLNYYFIDIEKLELPTVYIASLSGGVFKYVCGFVILCAIFTTAISSGYSFLINLNLTNRKFYCLIAFLICIISILLSNIGFSNLLNSLYPILGFLRFNTNYFYIVLTKYFYQIP